MIVVEPRKTADRPVICPVNVVPTPPVEVHKSRCVGTHAGELFPEEPEVVPAEMAKEASTEGPTDKEDLPNDRNYKQSLCTTLTTVCVENPKPRIQRPPDMMAEEASTGDTADNQPLSVNQLYTKTTVMNLPTDYVEIERPAPRRVQVDVAEEASTDDTTNEQCIYEVLDNNKTTDGKLSMELLEIPQQLVTRGFLELAEEARNIGVEKKQSFLVEEVLPQVTGMTRPMIEPVSETTDENLGQSVEVHHEGTARVPTVKFEAGQLMQWPDIKSDGVMIRGIMLESEMSPVGSVRHTAGPVSVAAESEMFTPVFAGGGGVVAAAAPLAVVEAVTSRVSVLPVVGSDLLTGLSAAVGVTDQLFLGSGSSLDKVGHGAGQSGVHMVLVERLPEFCEVRDIMFSWMRPVAVLTSQFFLSDEEGNLEMPLRINGGRASLQQEVDFNYCY